MTEGMGSELWNTNSKLVKALEEERRDEKEMVKTDTEPGR